MSKLLSALARPPLRSSMVALLGGLSCGATAATLDFPLVGSQSEGTRLEVTLRSSAGTEVKASSSHGQVNLLLPDRPQGSPVTMNQLFGFLGTCSGQLTSQGRTQEFTPTDLTVVAAGSADDAPLPFNLQEVSNDRSRITAFYTADVMHVTGQLTCVRADRQTKLSVKMISRPGWNLMRVTSADDTFTTLSVDSAPLGSLKLTGRLP